MIELMIVIIIIAILAALILPAINNVRRTARVAQVTTEIKNLEKAIADFKLKYGVEPPSSFVLYETSSNWSSSSDALTRNSINFIQQAWPDFSFNYGAYDFNNNGSAMDILILRGHECLVFFLGGPGMLDSTSPAPLGFSTNPTTPFASGGTRIGPFFEFDIARIRDTDSPANGIPEYLDPLPGQTAPYLYLSSYGGRGYQPFGFDGTQGTIDDEVPSSSGMLSAYIQSFTGPTGSKRPVYWNNKSFQLISPGYDTAYGTGGCYRENVFYDNTNGTTQRSAPEENDNITNFSGGMMVPR